MAFLRILSFCLLKKININFCIFLFFYCTYSLPLQIGIALYLLYTQVSFAFVAGVTITILLIPGNHISSKLVSHSLWLRFLNGFTRRRYWVIDILMNQNHAYSSILVALACYIQCICCKYIVDWLVQP